MKKIKVKRGQVRGSFDEEKIDNLAKSIGEIGQLQPVIVKRDGPGYLLVAGERRLRAIKKNKEKEIVAVIMDEELTDDTMHQIQLVENIQREDLNPLERAKAIRRLMDETGLNKKEVSKKLGVPRTTLTEWLNILEVSEKYQQEVLVEDSPLTLSHITLARALASRTGDPTKQNKLLDGIIKHKFSREETREIVEIINKYLHIEMEEAFNTILLKREHKKISREKEVYNRVREHKDPGKTLVESFANFSNRLEKFIEKIDNLEEDNKKNLIDEFLYIYQLMGIMIPELKESYRLKNKR